MKIALIGTLVSSTLNFRVDLISDLVTAGHQVYVFCVDYDAKHLKKISDLGATPVGYSLSRSGLNPASDFFTILQLVRRFVSIRPDVVLSTFVKPVIYASIAARLARVRYVAAMLEGLGYAFTDFSYHGGIKRSLVRRLQVFLYRLALPCIDHLIFLNHDDPVDLLSKNGLKVKRFSVLGGIGVDMSAYPPVPVPLSGLSFLFIGRLLAEKGIFDFVDAARRVREKHPDATFMILGQIDEGNPGSLTDEQFKRLVNEEGFFCPGHVEDVGKWISASSVFVLPSYREGFPRSTQEAMAVGRAVITTNVPGCRETVLDGINGFLINKSDPEGLAEKMIYFAENPEEVARMGAESRRIAEQCFDSKIVNKKLMAMIGCV